MVREVCPTKGFEKLLVATDGSRFSNAAVNEALEIAKTCSSKLFVLGVVEMNPEYEAFAPGLIEAAERKMRKHLEAIKAKATAKKVVCETIIHQGEEPYQYIVSEAAKRKVQTIIMGSHGRTGLKRLMMGSTTARVIGHSSCKVLVVPLKTGK